MFKQKSETPVPTPRSEPADAVQQARTRARHRLIGAIVLLAIGIIGFPLVFETQPRPIPVDIPIEIPRRDAMPPLAMPSAPVAVAAAPAPDTSSRTTEILASETAADAGRDVTPPPAAASPARGASVARAASAARAASVGRAASSAASATTAVARAAAPPPSSPARADGDRAQALLDGRSPPPVPGDGQRFIVQVGAFADAEAARETRKQVEKLGLKTYTQVAQTASGSRIRVRVGPFATRAEADAAVAKAKAASLAAVVLTL